VRLQVHDGRKETVNWTLPEYDDSLWQPAQTVEPPVGIANLTARPIPHVVAASAVPVARVTHPAPNTYVFDMALNFAGACAFRIPANLPPGTAVHFTHGEQMASDGTVVQSPATPDRHTGQPIVEATAYIVRGGATQEVFQPMFVYYGFRYVQVNIPVAPALEDMTCFKYHTDLAMAGSVGFAPPTVRLHHHKQRGRGR
jgi:alpha-L-rhamnosidase